YIEVSKKIKKIIELGCGSAVISLYLAKNNVVEVTSIDKNEQLIKIARKNVMNNDLKGNINVKQLNIGSVKNEFRNGSFDMVICNPPHFAHSGLRSSKESRNEWRRLSKNSLMEFAKATRWLLKNRGVFYFVIHPRDMAEWLRSFDDNKLGIHRMKIVHGKLEKQAQLILIKGRNNSTPEIVVEPPLILRKDESDVHQF
ncbi:MAG: tRNA1(Val) (adenine(37)-N6)-methyltransferase, partial [Kosmotogaceae bacterium]